MTFTMDIKRQNTSIPVATSKRWIVTPDKKVLQISNKTQGKRVRISSNKVNK